MTTQVTYLISFLLATLVHVLVVGLLMKNWSVEQPTEQRNDQAYYIQATVVGENPYTVKKRELESQAEQRRQKRDVQKRKAARLRKEAEKLEEEREAREAHNRLVELERLRTLQEAKIVREEERDEQPRFELPKDVAVSRREDNSRLAVTDDEKAQAYVAQIQRDIIQNWSRPPSARNGMQALLKVFLVPTGEIVDVVVQESSGNNAFDRSAMLAVNKTERFLVPSESRQFERNFREFTILFRPTDLRL